MTDRCVCVYICVWMYTCIHKCVYICVWMPDGCICVYIYVYTYVYGKQICVCVYAYVYGGSLLDVLLVGSIYIGVWIQHKRLKLDNMRVDTQHTH